MSALGFTPADLGTMLDMLLDPSMARPVKIFVERKSGNIWRIIDPLSPTENMPVIKEWTEEKTVTEYEEAEYEWEKKEEKATKKTISVPLGFPADVLVDYFRFDQPRASWALSDYDRAFSSSSAPTDIPRRLQDAIQQRLPNGQPLPANITQTILQFGHADMCASFEYNHSLTHRRNQAVKRVVERAGSTPAYFSDGGRIHGLVPCSDFNPTSGPNAHERAAEASATGAATNPSGGPDGNRDNRRVELYVLHDYNDRDSEITKLINQVRSELKDARGISDTEWPAGKFPCDPSNISVCHKLLNCAPNESNAGGTGSSYRQCEFYTRFTRGVNVQLQVEAEQTKPGKVTYTKKLVKEAKETKRKEVHGEYHPPPGEHYGFYMDEMVKHGVKCTQGYAPEIAVAPNDEEDPEDFNLIKPGPIKVVKMDVGFWGDERKRDSGRKAGFRREPARTFGVVEGPFVWLCYFGTDDNNGKGKGSDPEKNEKIHPLFTRFVNAVEDAGHKVRVMKKAVAEAGPSEDKLRLFFGDMHLPRAFDVKDADYSSGKCSKSEQMLKSLLLDMLRQDYQLRASQTPWLAADDRLRCLEFFEHGAKKLKLPHWNSARKISNPFEPEGSNWLAKAGDAVKKSMQVLRQFGYYMFEFTQDDLRREVKRFAGQYADRGRGRTKEVLSNWFYGFETDRNIMPADSNQRKTDPKQLIPGPIREILEKAEVLEGEETGTKPAEERWDKIDAGPARDLLRLLKIVDDQNKEHGRYISAYHCGDMFETWANRRYLFEDFENTDDPSGQLPDFINSVVKALEFGEAGSAFRSLGDGLKAILRTLLGGMNAGDIDLWHRREVKKRLPTGPLPDETTHEIKMPDVDSLKLPTISDPSAEISGVVPYQKGSRSGLTKEKMGGAPYVSAEMGKRVEQILAFKAPLREDEAGRAEDVELLGGAVDGNDGLWNKAIDAALRKADLHGVYGNHDCYRGLHGGRFEPYRTERNLWVEHAHRYEDSNVDGQPFGAFTTNLCFEIMEIALYEGLLDEYLLHREQNQYQPGIMQWFLLTEFQEQLDKLKDKGVEPFRVAVCGHTHMPDLIVAEIVYREKESTALGWITHLASIAKVIAALIPRIIEWAEKWDQRYGDDKGGWSKWFDDTVDDTGEFFKGAGEKTANWAGDFTGGIGECLEKAGDFLKKTGEGARKKLENEWDRVKKDTKQHVDRTRRTIDRTMRNFPFP